MADSNKEFGKSEPLLVHWRKKDIVYDTDAPYGKGKGAYVRVELDQAGKEPSEVLTNPVLCDSVWYDAKVLNDMARAGCWARNGGDYVIAVSDDLVLDCQVQKHGQPVFIAKPTGMTLGRTVSREDLSARLEENASIQRDEYYKSFHEEKPDFDPRAWARKLCGWKDSYGELFDALSNDPSLRMAMRNFDRTDPDRAGRVSQDLAAVMNLSDSYSLAAKLHDMDSLFGEKVPEWERMSMNRPNELFADESYRIESLSDMARCKGNMVKLYLEYESYPEGIEDDIPDGFISSDEAASRVMDRARLGIDTVLESYESVMNQRYMRELCDDVHKYALSRSCDAAEITDSGDMREDLLYWIKAMDRTERLARSFDDCSLRGILSLPTSDDYEVDYLREKYAERLFPDYPDKTDAQEGIVLDQVGGAGISDEEFGG